MRKVLLFTLLSVIVSSVLAQHRRPDWMFKLPDATGAYFYVREHGEALDSEAMARESAIKQVFRTVSHLTGVRFDQAEIEKAINEGTGLSVQSLSMEVPIKKVCEYTRKQKDGTFVVYLLYQVATVGYYKMPAFDYYDCDRYSQYNSFIHKKNVGAIIASAFLPGVGQMYKRNYAEGVFTLLGEGALIGGGVAMLQLSDNQKKRMNDVSGNINYDSYMSAKNKYNTYRYTAYGLFGAAAVLYGINLWRAWACRYRFKEIAFYPIALPSSSPYDSDTRLALGVGMNINF